MAKTRTKKASLNITSAAIYEVVSLVCSLILPRLILQNFGSSYNGIISSAAQFLSMISVLNLGVAGSTRAALYKTLANNDMAGTSAIVRATEQYMRKIGIILLVYIAGLAVVYPLIVNTGYSFWDVFFLIIAVGVSSFASYFFGVTYQAFLSADQSVYISNAFSIIATILNTMIAAFLIYVGCSIQVVRLGSAVVFFLKPFLQNVYVTKKYHLDKRCTPDNSALAKRNDAMAHSIANIIHDNTDVVILTLFCDVKIVSVYTVYNLIMCSLKKIQGVFTSGTESIFGDMWAKGEIERIKTNLSYYEYIITSFVSVVFSTTLVMILPFISLYTKGVSDVEYILPAYAMVITVAQAFYCIRSPYLTLVQGVGHYKETRNGAFVEAGINLGLSVVLVQIMGITGVAIGTLVANVFRTIQYAVYIDNKLIPRGKLVFIKRIIWTILNVGIIYIITNAFVIHFAYGSLLSWIECGVGVTLVGAAVTLISSLAIYREDLKSALQIGKRMLKK